MSRVVRRAATRARTRLPGPLDLPQLAAFLDGYLHEDFTQEHATPLEALAAFSRECSDGERDALARECQTLLGALAGLSWPAAQRAFAAIGGAWCPASREELTQLLVRARG